MRGNSNLVPKCFYSPDIRDLVPVLFSFNLYGAYTIFQKSVILNYVILKIIFWDFGLLLDSTAKERQERGEREGMTCSRGVQAGIKPWLLLGFP